MAEPTHTVARSYRTENGFFVVLQGRAMSFPIDAEVAEGASVRIEGGRAVLANPKSEA